MHSGFWLIQLWKCIIKSQIVIKEAGMSSNLSLWGWTKIIPYFKLFWQPTTSDEHIEIFDLADRIKKRKYFHAYRFTQRRLSIRTLILPHIFQPWFPPRVIYRVLVHNGAHLPQCDDLVSIFILYLRGKRTRLFCVLVGYKILLSCGN